MSRHGPSTELFDSILALAANHGLTAIGALASYQRPGLLLRLNDSAESTAVFLAEVARCLPSDWECSATFADTASLPRFLREPSDQLSRDIMAEIIEFRCKLALQERMREMVGSAKVPLDRLGQSQAIARMRHEFTALVRQVVARDDGIGCFGDGPGQEPMPTVRLRFRPETLMLWVRVGAVTPDELTEVLGRHPVNDDLHRANCREAGTVGHFACGWCDRHDEPRFACGCIVTP